MEARAQNAAASAVGNRSLVEALVEKWGELLEGVHDKHRRDVMALLYENSWRVLFHGGSTPGGLTEDTLSKNSGEYTKHIFPVLRRVFPNLIANELVSIQPITGPVGAITYFEYKHGKDKGRTKAGTELLKNFDRNYTSELVDGEVLALPDGAAFGGVGAPLSVTFGYSPVRPLDVAANARVVIQDVDADGTVVQEAIDNGAGGFTGDTTSGSINYATGQVTNFRFTAAPTAGAGRQIITTYRYDSESNRQTPSVFVDINIDPVRVRSRKMKARWSSEASDDLRALHGLDVSTEIVAVNSQEIGLEVDREILEELFQASAGITATFDFTVPAGITEVDHIRAVTTRMSNVGNRIFSETRRGRANWAVSGVDVSAKLEALQTHSDHRPQWVSDPAGTQGPFDGTVVPSSYGPITSHFGIQRLGPLSNKWNLYLDPFFHFGQILMGLRGESYLDAGYVYAPFVPIQLTPTLHDPEDDTLRLGVRTRYASKLLREEWFGRVTITGGL